MENNQLPDQLSDILLVLDTERKQIRAVKGIDKNGNLETLAPNKENNNQFMRVDRNGDLFSNFFTNFLRQLKDPTRFRFFKVSADIADQSAQKMQQHLNHPTTKGAALLNKHEIKQPDHSIENKNKMETTQTTSPAGEYRYKPE